MAYETFYTFGQDSDNKFTVLERESNKLMATCESVGRAVEVLQALEGKHLLTLAKQMGY